MADLTPQEALASISQTLIAHAVAKGQFETLQSKGLLEEPALSSGLDAINDSAALLGTLFGNNSGSVLADITAKTQIINDSLA